MDWSTRIRPAPFEDAKRGLIAVVDAFRLWAATHTRRSPPGEWEADYDGWAAISTAFIRLLVSSTPPQWDQLTIDTALYALARDNEMEALKNDLLDFPDHLFALAKAGLTFDDEDARWQLADILGSKELPGAECEALLERYVEDDDEYVRRRALLALSERGSPKAEGLAVRAWETGHEYQRMAALQVLAECGSSLLPSYLDLAEADGREYVVSRARELRGRQERQ